MSPSARASEHSKGCRFTARTNHGSARRPGSPPPSLLCHQVTDGEHTKLSNAHARHFASAFGAAAAPRAVADGRPKLAGLGEACGRRAYARLRPPVRPRAASDGRMAARLHLSPPRGTAGNARPFRFWTIARNVLRRVNKKLLSDRRERRGS